MPKVKAKRLGWDGLQRRRPDEVFDWKGDRVPSWVEVVDAKAEPAADAEAKKAAARAEHAKLTREGFGGNVSAGAQAAMKGAQAASDANKR